MVADPSRRMFWGLDCSSIGKGLNRWWGIVALGALLYAPPCGGKSNVAILVVDAHRQTFKGFGCSTIETSDYKWSGIARRGTRLHAAPHNARNILAVDPSHWTAQG